MGVYSCRWCWDGVFGTANVTSSVLAQLPLWYAHFDKNDTFSNDDYLTQAFGGWTSAVMKQYNETLLCGVLVDMSVYL